MKHLYELTAVMSELMDADDVTEDQLAVVFGDIQTKSANICHFLADLDGDITTFKAEEARIKARRVAMENRAEQVREYLKQNMIALGIDKLTAGTFKISLSPTVGTLEVENEDAIPASYKTVQTVVTIDKNAIKNAIKAGGAVPGASIKPGVSLRIR